MQAAVLFTSFFILLLLTVPIGYSISGASLVAQTALPAVRETQVGSLDQGDAPEKEMATHSSILAWRISGTEEPGGLPCMGSHRVGHD